MKAIKIATWFVLSVVLLEGFFFLLSLSDTIANILGLCLFIAWGILTIKTTFFTTIKFKRK